MPGEVTDYEQKAIVHAEDIGVYEFEVKGKYMEYWSFFGSEGWYFVIHDLDENKDVFRGANIPWDAEIGIPKFLLSKNGGTKYNYMTG